MPSVASPPPPPEVHVESPNGSPRPANGTDTPGSSSASSLENGSVRDHNRKQRFLPKHLLSPGSGRHQGLGRSASLSRLQIARQSASSLGESSRHMHSQVCCTFSLTHILCRPTSSDLPWPGEPLSPIHLERVLHPLSLASSIAHAVGSRLVIQRALPPTYASVSRARAVRSHAAGNEAAEFAVADERRNVPAAG